MYQSPAVWFSDALDLKVTKQIPESLESNVTSCRYSQFYKELKELGVFELGFRFVGAQDFPLTEGFSRI